jgi:hypothetical protein
MSTDDVGEKSTMTLRPRYSPASPFVRKVLVFAHETGLADRIERVPTDVWAPDSNIFRDNLIVAKVTRSPSAAAMRSMASRACLIAGQGAGASER